MIFNFLSSSRIHVCLVIVKNWRKRTLRWVEKNILRYA